MTQAPAAISKIPTESHQPTLRRAATSPGRPGRARHGPEPGSRGRDRPRRRPRRQGGHRAGLRDHGLPGPVRGRSVARGLAQGGGAAAVRGAHPGEAGRHAREGQDPARCRNRRTRPRRRRWRRSGTRRTKRRPGRRPGRSAHCSARSSPRQPRRSAATWTSCSRSTTTRPSTGSTCAPLIRSNLLSPR